MRIISQIRLFFRSLFLRRRVESELDEELRFHLNQQIRQEIARGSTPEEAARVAYKQLPGIEQQKELCRETRLTFTLENLVRDCRYSLHSLGKTPSFALVVILTLGLGIGANTAIFSLMEAAILHPLSYPNADRIVALSEADQQGNDLMVSWADFVDWRVQSRSLTGISAIGGVNLNLTGLGQAERLHGLRVSASLLSVLKARPLLGRDFWESDDKPGAVPVAILSHALWERRFGGDPGVIGRSVDLDGRPYSVIGVLGKDFRFPYARDIYIPIGLDADTQPSRGVRSIARVVARLTDGVSWQAASGELQMISRRLEHAYPEYNHGVHATIRPFAEAVAAPARKGLLTLCIAVGFLLLIACGNVACLLIARASNKAREAAIRVSLGASRSRLVSQALCESALLAFAGAVLGVVLASAALPALTALVPMDEGEMEQYVQPALNLHVLGFTVALAVLTTLLVGIAPCFRMSSIQPQVLRTGNHASAAGFRAFSFRSLLIISEIALSVVLLLGAGLLVQSLFRLRSANLGFQPDRLITARLKLPSTNYPTLDQRSRFFRTFLAQVNSLGSVAHASGATCLPFHGKGCWPSTVQVEGQPVPRPQKTFVNAIDPGYLETMQIPLVIGRNFTERDNFNHERVALVNQSFVRHYLPGTDGLGRRLLEGYASDKTVYRIVGIIGDARRESPEIPPDPEMFLPLSQVGPDALEIVVRTALPDLAGTTQSILQVARLLDPDVPLYDFRAMQWYFDLQTTNLRFPAYLLTAFSSLALSLAAVGVYGLLAYTVSQRSKEWGIRLALGAQRRSVMTSVMKQGLVLVVCGLSAGLVGSWSLLKMIKSLLFETRANDSGTIFSVCCVVILIAMLACLLPAYRACRVDPVIILRADQ